MPARLPEPLTSKRRQKSPQTVTAQGTIVDEPDERSFNFGMGNRCYDLVEEN
jgi:hypothetical protein